MKKLTGFFALILIASSILKLAGSSLAVPMDWVFLHIEQCLISLKIMPNPDALALPGTKPLILLIPIVLLFSIIHLILFFLRNRRKKPADIV